MSISGRQLLEGKKRVWDLDTWLRQTKDFMIQEINSFIKKEKYDTIFLRKTISENALSCLNNNKVLYDFADIESYSPDGTCYKNNADDACNYYDEDGDSIGNWAVEYQNSHTEGVDWYDCEAAHSEPINANLKAYAAWWMFASFAGWNYDPMPVIEDENTSIRGHVFPNPANDMAIFELEISGENIQPYVNVISPTGAVIQEYLQPTFTQGKILYNIDVSDLPPSIYYISVKCREHYINFKLSVL